MSWRDEPATIAQKLALRNALDKRYGMQQGREMYEELDGDNMTKGEASDEITKLYQSKKGRSRQ